MQRLYLFSLSLSLSRIHVHTQIVSDRLPPFPPAYSFRYYERSYEANDRKAIWQTDIGVNVL
jgi:hypothetical protein